MQKHKPKRRFQIRLAGKPWTIRYSSRMKEHYGWCDWRKREIVIATGQSPDDMRDTVMHECLHAVLPQHNEGFVTALANELNDALDTLDDI